jgi:hypothetical protein
MQDARCNLQLLKNPLGESRATRGTPPQPFRPRHFLERFLAPPAACSSGQGLDQRSQVAIQTRESEFFSRFLVILVLALALRPKGKLPLPVPAPGIGDARCTMPARSAERGGGGRASIEDLGQTAHALGGPRFQEKKQKPKKNVPTCLPT